MPLPRPRFRIRLRTLLIVVAVAALMSQCCWWFLFGPEIDARRSVIRGLGGEAEQWAVMAEQRQPDGSWKWPETTRETLAELAEMCRRGERQFLGREPRLIPTEEYAKFSRERHRLYKRLESLMGF